MIGENTMPNALDLEMSDEPNRVLVKLGIAFLASNLDAALENAVAVSHILAERNPFKIHKTVVTANPVLVVGMWSFWINSVKRLKDQSVDPDLRDFAVFAETDVKISAGPASRFNYANLAAVVRRISAYLPKIVDGVKTLKAGYCDPQFVEVNIVRHFRPFLLKVDMVRRACGSASRGALSFCIIPTKGAQA